MDTVYFHCTACGKCCNSAPLLSFPELLRYENLFIGCLAVRRVSRLTAGSDIEAGGIRRQIDPAQALAHAEWAESSYFHVPGLRYEVSITTQALDYLSLNKCPALLDDQRCALHDTGKPVVCSMVPFDADYPDGMQGIVLLSRQFEEGCIVDQRRDGHSVLFEHGRVANAEYQGIIDRRRKDLAEDKWFFGNTVFQALRNEFFSGARLVARIPAEGFLSLSLIPALAAVAVVSDECRARCLRYVDSQIALIERTVQAAIARRVAADKPVTRELRGFREAYLRFRPALLEKVPEGQGFAVRPEDKAEVERYLGIG